MNVPEIAWRVHQKALQKTEYKRFFICHLPVTEILLPKDLLSLYPLPERLEINWNNKNYQLFECLDLFGVFDYQTYKKKWNAGFQTENVWPTTDFSYGISINQREDIGDIRTNWELNRHFQFVGLAKNYYVTGAERYFHELNELFKDWNRNNLFLHGVQWISAMEVAIRIVSWTYMYIFVEKTAGSTKKDFLEQVAHGIKVMTNYVLKHRARYSSANNHLIVEMLGVGVAGILFDYKKWTDTAINILTEELPKQNSVDGVNKEMSLHYQSFTMEAYGLLWLLMKKNGIKIPASWKIYLTRMSEFVADCCGDYGEVVVFGDNDEGKILDFCGKMENHYQYVLQLMGMILDNRYTELKLFENIEWIVDSQEVQDSQTKKLYSSGLVQSYKEGGYTILRSKDHKVLIGFDHAELGYGSIAAHGHADALSIQIFYEGKPVLVDPGTYNYHFPKEVRNKIRKTASHNTVYIEGKEQAEILGPFMWGKRYSINPVNIIENSTTVLLCSRITYAGVAHERKIEFDYNTNITIRDKVESKQDTSIYQVWNLMDDSPTFMDNQVVASSIIIRIDNHKMKELHTYEYSDTYCSSISKQVITIELNNKIASTTLELIGQGD